MKLIVFHVFTMTLLMFVGTARSEEFYAGIDIGHASFDQSFIEDATNYGVSLGYTWNRWSVEGVANFSETDDASGRFDQSIQMYHLYGAFRTTGKYYFKAKAGLSYERYDFDGNSGIASFDDNHIGIARGVGVGARSDSINVELEYNWLGGSIRLVSLGIKFTF